jgi:hypothetical protein
MEVEDMVLALVMLQVYLGKTILQQQEGCRGMRGSSSSASSALLLSHTEIQPFWACLFGGYPQSSNNVSVVSQCTALFLVCLNQKTVLVQR